MNTHHSFRLRAAMLLAIASLIFIAILSNVYQQRVLQHTATNSRLLGEYQQLNQLALSIQRSAKNYQANAARDYESYFRDVEVYLGDLKGTITQFHTLVDSIADKTKNDVTDLVPPAFSSLMGNNVSQGTLAITITDVSDSWLRYMSGFETALGENQEEPRIEWGTRFVLENSDTIEHKLHVLMDQYETYLQQQGNSAATIFKTYLLVIAVLGAAIIGWFYLHVIRPIGLIANACTRVAGGDFGYTLPIQGKNELAQLSEAFNTMSSRSEMVLNLISQLQQAHTVDEATAIICRASGSYIPIAWAAILKADQTNTLLNVASTLPAMNRSQLESPQIKANTAFGQQCHDALLSKQAFISSDLLNAARQDHSDQFINGLVRRSQIDALMCVPLYNNQGWEGMLIFGSKSGKYTSQHTELLSKLAPLLTTHLQKIV